VHAVEKKAGRHPSFLTGQGAGTNPKLDLRQEAEGAWFVKIPAAHTPLGAF